MADRRGGTPTGVRFIEEVGYTTNLTGELVGIATATAGPDIDCVRVKFKAVRSNTGNVYIGFSSGVLKVAGTTNAVSGWELDAGEETPWLYVNNLSETFRICDGIGDDLVYIAQR